MTNRGLLVGSVVAISMLAVAATLPAQLAPNAPADKPVSATSEAQVRRIEAAIAPYIEAARITYPQAKARYLAGLPKGETFFVTARLSDARGRIEMVFVQVQGIAEGRITGRIASRIMTVGGHRQGDTYTLPEEELVDWMIAKADGSEEGNVVGKFLDTYQPR